jgi:hypothetical protein
VEYEKKLKDMEKLKKKFSPLKVVKLLWLSREINALANKIPGEKNSNERRKHRATCEVKSLLLGGKGHPCLARASV